jgi:hypothetical protein
MKEMVKHVPDTGSYAPVTILVDERLDGVRLSVRIKFQQHTLLQGTCYLKTYMTYCSLE